MDDRSYFYFDALRDSTSKTSGKHFHNEYEIYYLIKGKCWYFIGKNSYLLSEGDLAVIPPGVIHGTSYDCASHSRFLINCSSDMVPPSTKKVLGTIPYVSLGEKAQKRATALFSEINEEQSFVDNFSNDAIKTALWELLLLVAREGAGGDRVRTESPTVQKVVSYVAKNYSTDISLEDVARECFVSREHLSRTFKKEAGLGFCEYLCLYRLKKADALLKERPELSVVEVALACGFNDGNYFSRVYKKTFGISPVQAKSRTK